MKKRRFIIVASLLGLLLASFLLMRFLIAQKKDFVKTPTKPGDRYVKAEPVKYTTLKSIVNGEGRVLSSAELDLIAEASGKIERGDVPLKTGQSFQRGDVLLTVYKDEVELALKAQKSSFLNRLANVLPDLQIDFPDRYPEFKEFFNAVNLDDDMPPLPDYTSEKLKIFLAGQNILNDYYSIVKNEKQLKRHTLYAPFNGTFLSVSLEVGAYTNVGGRIARIIHTDTVEVQVPIENGFAKWIRVGAPVTLQASETGQTWQGNVIRIAEFVDKTTQSRPVFVQVPLMNQTQLYAGQYLSASFKGGQIHDVMEIPRNAIFNFNTVFVVREGRLKKETIDIVKVNDQTVFFRGVEPGTFIVVQPLINVSENIPVKILGRDEPANNSSTS